MENEKSQGGMKDLSLDEAIPEQFQGGFIDKKVFLEPQPVMVLHDIKKNQFDRFTLKIAPVGQLASVGQWVNIGAQNVNQLRDLFGPVPKGWLGKRVRISGEEFDDMIRDKQTGKERRVSGVTLTISDGAQDEKEDEPPNLD